MVEGQDINMVEILKSKFDAIINVLATLSHRTTEIEGIMARLQNDRASRIAQSRIH